MLNEFLEWAKNNGWNVIPTCDKTDLPDEIKRRYDIPSQWYSFICSFQICEDRSETKWFLTPKDYYPQDKGFQWNDIIPLEQTHEKTKVWNFKGVILCQEEAS